MLETDDLSNIVCCKTNRAHTAAGASVIKLTAAPLVEMAVPTV